MSERSREAPPYFLIHLVSREAMTPLVASQVVDHAEIHATTPGATAPVGVAVGLIEPARVALTRALRERAREFARRAPHTRIAVLPFAGRFLGASVAFRTKATAPVGTSTISRDGPWPEFEMR